jgi:hypothetical protein
MISRDKLSNAEPSLDEIKAVVRKALPGGGEVTDATWITNFRLHHRVVNSYRDGRLLLVGDAAHLHSPVGGQGLNTGMQDALNLGWKLGRVVRGDRPDSLLDTFDEERRRIGEDLVAKTDRAFKLVSMTNPMAVRLRNWVVPWLAPYVTSRANLETSYNYLSQFGIHYRESSIVQKDTEFSGPVMAGDRAPDGEVDIDGENTRFHKILAPESYNFVLFSGSLRNGSDLENMKRTAVKFEARNTNKARVHMIVQERGIKHIPYSHRLHRTYGFSSPGFVYMRPDGYVAAVGHLDQIEAFLEWLS